VRLFLAIDADHSTRRAAARVRDAMRQACPGVDRALRWVDIDQLHLTLRFLGERSDDAAVAQVLKEPLAAARFAIEWGACTWLPPRGRPRILHVGVTHGAEALAALFEEVSRRLARLDIQPDARPYTPHLTLARVRDGVEPGLLHRAHASVPADGFGAEPLQVSGVTLYESELTPRGPVHRVKMRAELL
jgi:2'-5' RNA ligase